LVRRQFLLKLRTTLPRSQPAPAFKSLLKLHFKLSSQMKNALSGVFICARDGT